MQENRIKKVVGEGGVAIGVAMSEFATRGIAKILEYAQLDWVVLDVRHSGFSIDVVADVLAWFKSTPITVVVSPYNYLLPAVMDAGALAVQIENVESAAAAKAIVDLVMYPPLGRRAVSINKAHTDFTRPDVRDYVPWRNAQTSIVANIESQTGLDNVEEIAAIEGIDIIQPSHNDLSISLGIAKQYDHPKYKDALKRITAAARSHGKMIKFNCLNQEEVDFMYEHGCRIMALKDAVTLMQDALVAGRTDLRAQIGKARKK